MPLTLLKVATETHQLYTVYTVIQTGKAIRKTQEALPLGRLEAWHMEDRPTFATGGRKHLMAEHMRHKARKT